MVITTSNSNQVLNTLCNIFEAHYCPYLMKIDSPIKSSSFLSEAAELFIKKESNVHLSWFLSVCPEVTILCQQTPGYVAFN